MHRFHLTGLALTPGSAVDLTPLARQIHGVLRLRPGDKVALFDGSGGEACVELIAVSPYAAQGVVLTWAQPPTEPVVELTLYQCSLKGDKFEWLLQKGTELGVAAYVPVISARSIVRPAAALHHKASRWRAIIREAAEQSGRCRLPALRPPLTFAEAVSTATGERYLPWEEAAGSGASGLGAAVERSQPQALSVLVGPEGGLLVEEVNLAAAAGWQVVSLGLRTLRAETAACAAIAIVMDRAHQLG